VLYLAEVQKKAGILGSGKAEFKLLACQRAESSWSAVPGDEVIGAPDDASYNAGALVMVELSNNRQVQRHYEAGRTLTTILQTFSSQSKKFKTQEEEIEQWKQSLTFQSQELNRREVALEARQEQVDQAEADLEQLERQRRELEAAQKDVAAARADLERKNKDLEGAWAHLNGEMRRLEENQSAQAQPSGLDQGQADQLQAALGRLTEVIVPADGFRSQLRTCGELLDAHQHILQQQRSQLEQQRSQLEQQRGDLAAESDRLSQRWQDWHQSQETLSAKRASLKFSQDLLISRQDQLQGLSKELHRQGNLHQQVYDLLNTTDKVRLSKKVDVAALEAMAMDALQRLVADLEQDLGKMSRFVSDQEEELTLEQQDMDELKQKIEQANEFDRLQLEAELAEEQDRYHMLNETLVGQRRNLLEREEVLSQHQAVLRRRQGLAVDDTTATAVDLEPLLEAIDEQRHHTTEAIHALEVTVKQQQDDLQQLKQEVEQLEASQQQARTELEAAEADLNQRRDSTSRLAGQIQLCDELLPPVEEGCEQIRGGLGGFSTAIDQLQEATDRQLQAINELQQAIASTVPQQAAAS